MTCVLSVPSLGFLKAPLPIYWNVPIKFGKDLRVPPEKKGERQEERKKARKEGGQEGREKGRKKMKLYEMSVTELSSRSTGSHLSL